MKQRVLGGHAPQKFLEQVVILRFERRYPEKNTVARLASNFLALEKFFGLSPPLYRCITCQRCL